MSDERDINDGGDERDTGSGNGSDISELSELRDLRPTDDSRSFASPAAGFRTAIPVVIAYVPIGMAAGVVGQQAGLSPAEVALLSLLVFAGLSQFVFADMVAGAPVSAASAPAIVITIFLINLRHFLYSIVLMPKLRHLSTAKRAAVGAQLTDEGFAIFSLLYRSRYGAGGLIAFNVSIYIAWCSGTVMGAVAGNIYALDQWGIDYLLIAIFAALMILKTVRAKQRRAALVALAVAGCGSVGLELLYASHSINILIVSAIAAAAAMPFQGAVGDGDDGADDE